MSWCAISRVATFVLEDHATSRAQPQSLIMALGAFGFLWYLRILSEWSEEQLGPNPVRPAYRAGLLLSMVRPKLCANPKDKIFALLGIFQWMGIDLPDPDYSKSLEQILCEATVAVITSDQTLDLVLAEATNGHRNGNIPSWVPDWSTPGVADIDMFTYCSNSSLFKTLDGEELYNRYPRFKPRCAKKMNFHFVGNNRILVVRGHFRIVKIVGNKVQMSREESMRNLRTFNEWFGNYPETPNQHFDESSNKCADEITGEYSDKPGEELPEPDEDPMNSDEDPKESDEDLERNSIEATSWYTLDDANPTKSCEQESKAWAAIRHWHDLALDNAVGDIGLTDEALLPSDFVVWLSRESEAFKVDQERIDAYFSEWWKILSCDSSELALCSQHAAGEDGINTQAVDEMQKENFVRWVLLNLLGCFFHYIIMKECAGRQCFITTDGKFGTADGDLQPGDLVGHIQGASEPITIRKVEKGYILLSAGAYVAGTMNGETWPKKKADLMEVRLL